MTETFQKDLALLKTKLGYVEDDTFDWDSVVAILVLRLANTDCLHKDNPASHATQIQLTDSGQSPPGLSKTDDFFPTLVVNDTFSRWRLSVEALMSVKNLKALNVALQTEDSWILSRIQIRRRRPLNDQANPVLHLCYGDDLRELRNVLCERDYLVIAKLKNVPHYYAFGLPDDACLGDSKRLSVRSDEAANDQTQFLHAELSATSDPKWSALPVSDDDPFGLAGAGPALRRALSALQAGKNVIFVGPPGTAKSELAVKLCKSLEVHYDLVTATSNWSTFETIGGYMPDPSAAQPGAPEPLNFSPGAIVGAIQRNHWLIVDEINRADMDKAFGEMFTLLSAGLVRLPFKTRVGNRMVNVVLGHPSTDTEDTLAIPLPQDWRLLATMNTFDKASLHQLSFALMRRFAFVEVTVPEKSKYRDLLRDRVASRMTGGIFDDTSREAILRLLASVFATGSSEGLGKLGLLVGPAIPLDIVDYLVARVETLRSSKEELASPRLVLEGLELYLYPQFEGRDREHDGILRAISEALSLTEEEKAVTGKSLSLWTGFEANAE